MTNKRKVAQYLILVIVLALIIPIVSAGIFSDAWNKLTGKATSSTTSVNITVGNSAPTIGTVNAISAQSPTESSTTAITFNFTATDTDGQTNINTSSAQASFNKSGETTRSNTSCVNLSVGVGNNINFTCTVYMYYYDSSGSWSINVTVKDINAAQGENSSTSFTYNLLTAMTMAPTALTWSQVGLTDIDTGSNNDPIAVNNTGNDIDLGINVTGINLRGETTLTQNIFANNFTVENASQGCSGTALSNATSLNITSAILQKGNNSLNHNNATSGQEQIYFCLKGVPQSISSQSYSSTGNGAWTVQVIT